MPVHGNRSLVTRATLAYLGAIVAGADDPITVVEKLCSKAGWKWIEAGDEFLYRGTKGRKILQIPFPRDDFGTIEEGDDTSRVRAHVTAARLRDGINRLCHCGRARYLHEFSCPNCGAHFRNRS